MLDLIITYSPTYPDELPEISIECVEGELSDEEDEELVMGLIGAVSRIFSSDSDSSLGQIWARVVVDLLQILMDSSCTGKRLAGDGRSIFVLLLRRDTDSILQAMVYTLSLYLRESLAALLEARYARIQHEADEKARILEEVRQVPLSSLSPPTDNVYVGLRYQDCRNKSDTRVVHKVGRGIRSRTKAEGEARCQRPTQGSTAERAGGNASVYRQAVRWVSSSLRRAPTHSIEMIGRQLFEKGDAKLATSDGAFDEEGAVSVDASQYERVEGFIEEEEEERDLGEMSD